MKSQNLFLKGRMFHFKSAVLILKLCLKITFTFWHNSDTAEHCPIPVWTLRNHTSILLLDWLLVCFFFSDKDMKSNTAKMY